MPRGDLKTGYATIDDVAKLANVSRITVSRVFSGKWQGKIRQKTIDKVLEAAQTLQYTPNNLARGLSSQRSNIVAVVVNARPGFFYSEVVNRMVEAIQLSGRQALMFTVDTTDELDKIVNQVMQHRVDAIVVTSAVLSKRILKFLMPNPPIPVILFKRMPPTPAFSGVWCDEAEGAHKAARYLYETGHRHIGIIGYTSGDTGRCEAFATELERLGVVPVERLERYYSHQAGWEAANCLMERHKHLDAIFCDEDTIATGVMDALRQKWGLRIPDDISVVGFDDSSIAAMPAYSLTTVGHPLDDMIIATINAIDQQEKNIKASSCTEFSMELICRGSTMARQDAKIREKCDKA